MAFKDWLTGGIAGLLEKVADRGGAIIQELVKDKDLAAKLDHEFRLLLSSQAHEIEKLELEVETRMFEAQQETIQAELHQNDLYTKRTRPKMARLSFYLAFAYVVFAMVGAPLLDYWTTYYHPDTGEIVHSAFYGLEPQWGIFITLVSPTLTYMGVRGFDKWKNPHG